jgi:transcriptional regulator with XRE-family HTH domain
MGSTHATKSLGEKVKTLRLAAGISQLTLSKRSGVFRTHVSRIECGRANPTLTAILALAQALEVEPGYLLDSVEAEPGVQQASSKPGAPDKRAAT